MIINHLGQIVDIFISTGNMADNNKDLLRKITENFWGLLIGDKGYITSINHQLENNGIHLVTKVRKNMTPVKYAHRVEYYKKHHGLVETSIGLLKNKANIQHTRHRSTINFEVNIWAAMIAYSYNDKLPSIKTFKQNIKPLSPIHNQMQISIAA